MIFLRNEKRKCLPVLYEKKEQQRRPRPGNDRIGKKKKLETTFRFASCVNFGQSKMSFLVIIKSFETLCRRSVVKRLQNPPTTAYQLARPATAKGKMPYRTKGGKAVYVLEGLA